MEMATEMKKNILIVRIGYAHTFDQDGEQETFSDFF